MVNSDIKHKDMIINLVGASGSGKTTIAKRLEKMGYNIIKSYTTREPREPNEWGHTFVSDDSWYLRDEKNSIAEKELYDHAYWATKQQYQNKGTSIYITCPDGASQVKQNVEDAEVVIIYIQCDEDTRMYRMNHDATRSAKSINERLDKDKEVFRVCECDFMVDGNRSIESVVNDIHEIIERF